MSHEPGDSHHSAHHPQDDDQSFSGHHTPHSFTDDLTHSPHWFHDPGHQDAEHDFLGVHQPLSGEHATNSPDDHAKDMRHEIVVSDSWVMDVKPPEDYFGSQ